VKLFDELNEDNFILFAIKNYYNPKCVDVDEFYEDLNRFKYVKRLLNRYLETGKLSERLILNHMVIIFNSFDVDSSLKMLEYKFDHEHWKVIKPFLLFLRYISVADYPDVEIDNYVTEALRKI